MFIDFFNKKEQNITLSKKIFFEQNLFFFYWQLSCCLGFYFMRLCIFCSSSFSYLILFSLPNWKPITCRLMNMKYKNFTTIFRRLFRIRKISNNVYHQMRLLASQYHTHSIRETGVFIIASQYHTHSVWETGVYIT